jgi:hypothetical protein
MAASPVKGVYDTVIDRDSAEEVLAARHAAETTAGEPAPQAAPRGRAAPTPRPAPAPRAPRRSNRQTPLEALTKSVLRTAGSTLTRELLRGVLGGLKRR